MMLRLVAIDLINKLSSQRNLVYIRLETMDKSYKSTFNKYVEILNLRQSIQF